jgi:DNA helicase HerA-like ATPase
MSEEDMTATAIEVDAQPSESVAAGRGANAGNLIGRVASPPQLESTSEQFYFWVERGRLVERTQLVRAESIIDGRLINFYGLIDEVHRRSRKRDIHEEFDITDGKLEEEPVIKPEGVTYATVSILRVNPPLLTPPIEQSKVYLGGESEADFSYGFGEMYRSMVVGRLRNGGSSYAGLAKVDLAYLLGDNGGHVNVNGMTGAGTKSSFLLTIIKLLLNEAENPAAADPLHIVPIILNVKGEDLMWIDRPNREFEKRRERYIADWNALGIEAQPFLNAKFYAPTEPGTNDAPTIDGCNAEAYSWSLSDALSEELFRYLFSADDSMSPTMQALVSDLVAFLTEFNGKQLRSAGDVPQTWDELLTWIRAQAARKDDDRDVRMHQTGTWRAVFRRLWDILSEGASIFPRDRREGRPLSVTRTTNSPPLVIDIHDLSSRLQRFVVASVLKQVVAARTGRHAIRGLRYIVMLDELNRFAPRGSADEITRLLEEAATERRSQGVILLGAQQFASQVSIKVIESAAVRALGRTGPAELQDRVWQSWEKAVRRQANSLMPEEKLITQPTFRQPMFTKVPFPAWAMRREDIAPLSLDQIPEV